MAMDDCLRRKISDGDIPPDKARQMLDEYEATVQEKMDAGIGERKAQQESAQETFEAFANQVVSKKNQYIRQAQTARDIVRDLKQYADGNSPGAARMAMEEYDPFGNNQFADVESNYNNLVRKYHTHFEQVLNEQIAGVAGIRSASQKAQMRNVVREVYDIIDNGEGGSPVTGDETARSMARAWIDTDEIAVNDFIDAGGSLMAREDFRVPQQIHERSIIMDVPKEEWMDFVKSRNVQVRDYNTGDFLEGDELDEVLSRVYDNIVTEGRAADTPGVSRRRILAENRTDHRVLEFQDADSWLEYQEKFSNNTVLDILRTHIQSFARDTAQMQRFGPNVEAGRQFANDMALRIADDIQIRGEDEMGIVGRIRHGGDFVRKTQSQINKSESMAAHFRGDFYTNSDTLAAEGMAGLRNTLVSAQMGTAQLWATTDVGYAGLTAKFNGLPATRTMGNILKNMSPTREFDRAAAGRSGLIADMSNGMSLGNQRFLGFMEGPAATEALANFTIQASHLNRWTRTARWSFGMEMLGHTADMKNRSWSELGNVETGTVMTQNGVYRRALERYGIDGEDWDIIRTAEPFTEQGYEFIRPADIRNHPRADEFGQETLDEVARKYNKWLATETQYAIPTTSLRGRSLLIGDAQRGTFVGELARSIAMYKSFPTTMIYTHLTRAFTQAGGVAGTLQYLSGVAIASTVIGGMANQLNQIASGRDPRDMSDPEFWMESFVRGGGGGLFADYLLEDVNRFGGSFWTTLSGPAASFANDSFNFTVGNVQEMVRGEDTQFGKEFTKNMKRFFPGGNIFYIKLFVERMLHDNLERWADPNGARSQRSTERFFQRELDQDFWWEPGEATPSRAPDVTAGVGGS